MSLLFCQKDNRAKAHAAKWLLLRGEGRLTELWFTGPPLPSPGEGAWLGSFSSSCHLPSLSMLSSWHGPFWLHQIRVRRSLWHHGETLYLPMPVGPCMTRERLAFPYMKHGQVSHCPSLPCCDSAGVPAWLAGQPAASSGCKCSSPALGPGCCEQGGRGSCRLQRGYPLVWEGGAAEACASPCLCKAPGCGVGWHRRQSKLLPAPSLCTLGSSV